MAFIGDAYLAVSDCPDVAALSWRRLSDGSMRADVSIPRMAAPISVLAKVTSEDYLPFWEPRPAPEFFTEFYPTDRGRRTDVYECYVGVFKGGANECDVNPQVFDEYHSSGPYSSQLAAQRCAADVLGQVLANL